MKLNSRNNRVMLLASSVWVFVVAAWLGFHQVLAVQAPPTPAAQAPKPPPPSSASTDIPPPAQPAPKEPAESLPKTRTAKREYGLLTVASEPWGTLYIDDVEIGPTPVAGYRLNTGTHRLRIEQEGYRTRNETIVVSGGNSIRRRYSLEPQ